MARPIGSTTRARKVKDARQQAWNAFRVYKVFTVSDIGPVAEISERNLRAYVQALHRSGHLTLEHAKRNGHVNGHAVWRLARNSGPRRPHPLRDGAGVYDPNLDTVFPYREEAPDGKLARRSA